MRLLLNILFNCFYLPSNDLTCYRSNVINRNTLTNQM